MIGLFPFEMSQADQKRGAIRAAKQHGKICAKDHHSKRYLIEHPLPAQSAPRGWHP